MENAREELGARSAPSGPLGASGFLTGSDGVEHFYRAWEPKENSAVVLAFHDLAAHGEWYESLAAELVTRNIATVAPDLRGHGLTRWDLGRIPRRAHLLRDAEFWIAQVRERLPEAPLFLLGTGLGGVLAVVTAAGRKDLKGLLLLSPTMQAIDLPWSEKAVMLLSLLFGRPGGALTPLGRGLPLCMDQLRMQWLRKDPLAQTWLPARSHWRAHALIRRGPAALRRVTVPLLCVQGGLDPVASSWRNARLFGVRRRTRFVLWEETAHDLALERDVSYLAGLLADWIRHQLAQT